MIQKIKKHFLIIASLIVLAVPAIAAPAAYAACNSTTANAIANGASTALNSTSGGLTTCTGNSTGSIGNLSAQVVNIFSVIVGVAAVIMIIYGGFRYVTSGGDSGRISSAKNSLIYAIVGLIIVALAQVIVHFVLTATNNVTQ